MELKKVDINYPNIKNVDKKQSLIYKDDQAYPDDFERISSSQSRSITSHLDVDLPKAIVYSKKKENINDNIVYTISKNNERPPRIDDLINLKVHVPKIRISKYLEEKHSPTNEDEKVK